MAFDLMSMFGGGDLSGFGDLLTEEQKKAIAQQSMLAMGAQLLKASAPSTTPTNLGATLGGAFEAGISAREKAQQSALTGMLTKAKIQEMLDAQKFKKQFFEGGDVSQGQGISGPRLQAAGEAPAPGLQAPGGVGMTSAPSVIGIQSGGARQTPADMQTQSGALQKIAQNLPVEMQALLRATPASGFQKALMDVSSKSAKYGQPVNAMIDGKPVMVQYNEYGVPRVVPGATPYQATSADIQGYNLAKEQGYPGSFFDWRQANKAGTTVNVDTKGPVAFAQTGGSEAGKMLSNKLDAAQSANRTLQTIDRIVPALDQAILGPGADYRTTLYRIGKQLGYAGNDAQVLSRTAQVVQGLAQNELTAAEAMKGQGQITEGERALLKRAASGDQNMTADELRTVMAAMQKISAQRQSDYLDMFGRAKNVKGFSEIAPMYEFNPYQPQVDLSGNLATLNDPIAAELERRRKAKKP